MKKVKIVLGHSLSSYDEYSLEVIRAGITDWEEVTDEEYAFIKQYLGRLCSGIPYDHQPYLFTQDDKPVRVRIENLKKVLAEEQKKVEAERAAREAKKKERDLKRALKANKTKEELFEQLKAELGK